MKMSIKKTQQGAVLVVFVAAAAVLIGMAGLALDMGHLFLNKTRLQNALDAAALSGAKTLNDGASVTDAETDAIATFNLLTDSEMAAANLVPTVDFSVSSRPFNPGAIAPDARFVRVTVADFSMDAWLTRILPGIDGTQSVAGMALAGPSPPLSTAGQVCDIAPILMCGDPADTDCSDGACYGYNMGSEEEIELKTNSKNAKADDWIVGPGNFQLIELGCGPGGNCVREALAGGYSGCATGDGTVPTKPGNTVGPTAQGFNTRFGIYQGGMSASDYPPDTVTYDDAGAFWHSDYVDRQANGPLDNPSNGVPLRRILTVPIGNCTGTTNGSGDVDVLGFGCFFMTQPTDHSGQTQTIYGQLIADCNAEGEIPETPPPGTGGPVLFKIVLYNDPGTDDA